MILGMLDIQYCEKFDQNCHYVIRESNCYVKPAESRYDFNTYFRIISNHFKHIFEAGIPFVN